MRRRVRRRRSGLELRLEAVGWPVLGAVGRIFEHLFHDLTAEVGVGRALDLSEGGDAVLIDEEVVEAEPTTFALPPGTPSSRRTSSQRWSTSRSSGFQPASQGAW